MHAMTAAHTTLPLPTWVEVTNLVNGKRVVVKVNDRGPFVDNRLIDLSFAAATALDMVGTGTTRVEVRAVAPPAEAFRAATPVVAAGAPPPPAPGASVERMFLQVGAFAQQENAERLVARLRASGFTNPTLVTEPDDGRRLHRVWLGPVRDSVEYDALDARLRSIGVSNARLVTARAP
jgi:rare lipoprotein A